MEERITTRPWHADPIETVIQEVGSAAGGLGSAEARRRLQTHGPNQIQKSGGVGPLGILWRQINNPLIYVLLASAALAVLMGKMLDGLVVFGVVALNTIIGFLQEYKAGKAIEALMDLVPERATVLRDGVEVQVFATEIVPGDVVILRSGDRVPADLRLMSIRSLMVDEATLTGESAPVAKTVGPVPAEAVVAERHNMAYGGTLVTWGTGTGMVIATGNETEFGRISALMSDAGSLETALTRAVAKVGHWLTIGILVVSVLLFGVGLLRGYPLVDALLAAITLAVAAIPEGLPAIITIALAIGVQRMAKRQAVVRHLPAVETLGSTSVICSDKTGTLTRNEMTVTALWTPQGPYVLSGVGYAPEGVLTSDGIAVEVAPEPVRQLLLAGVLCSDATLENDGGNWRINGDPTEGALVVAAEKLGLQGAAVRSEWPRLDAIPFESERQFMATLHGIPDGAPVIYVKGAPEVVIGLCDTLSGDAPLDRAAVLAEVERFATQGMRVLALACRRGEGNTLSEMDVTGGFTLLGLQSMIDPPRPEAISAIEACHRAGITVKMITGDHLSTAAAIGAQLGIMTPGSRALSGADLALMSDDELGRAAAGTNVFARVAPEQKLRLVKSLQAQGQVVAMTGDGVNDGPALKQADIGVAMGITGTAVAKEASAIVLADDNFASIRAAVEEGRRVYDNLVKSLAFALPTNLGEALIILVAVLFFPMVGGVPLMPILPVQILWINLVATVTLALPLAFEAMEPDVMSRKPRSAAEPIMSRFVLVRTAIVAVLMTVGALVAFWLKYNGNMAAGTDEGLALKV